MKGLLLLLITALVAFLAARSALAITCTKLCGDLTVTATTDPVADGNEIHVMLTAASTTGSRSATARRGANSSEPVALVAGGGIITAEPSGEQPWSAPGATGNCDDISISCGD